MDTRLLLSAFGSFDSPAPQGEGRDARFHFVGVDIGVRVSRAAAILKARDARRVYGHLGRDVHKAASGL